MFYRQAELFVRYLKRTSEFKFGLLMLKIADGGDFDKSFRATYGMSIDETWQNFIDQLREKLREMQFAVNAWSLSWRMDSIGTSLARRRGAAFGSV